MYVDTKEALRELVDQFAGAPVVGVDTEFMRERTYFAKLCLIQIATDETSAIIDPLAIDDLSSLGELMCSSSTLKIFHAGGQDLEIFDRLYGCATTPVFDTQVAATLAGFPQQVGYGALVREMLGVEIDKGDTYTDWGKRPLSKTQVEYALNDVRYLPELYRRLVSRLDEEGRLGWLSEDFGRMECPDTYEIVPLAQWQRVKRISSLNRRQLAVAREVAAWRETEAMRRDVPKRWVLGDESIVEIARRGPKQPDELLSIRGVQDKISRSSAKGLLEAVARGQEYAEEDLPSLKRKRRPAGDVDSAVDLMVAIVRQRARERGVAMPLLASRDELERLAAGDREDSPLLDGWKRAMVGDELVDLLDGKLSLRLADGELMVEREQEA